jgi:predicted phosphodiesterase
MYLKERRMEKNVKERATILTDYVKLARKLGKLPSSREVKKFLYSGDKIKNHFGSFNNLKEECLRVYPELSPMVMPALLHVDDVEAYRLGLEKKKRSKQNSYLVNNVSSLEYISKFAESVFSGKVQPVKPPKKGKINRAVNLTLSDLHFGANIRSEETGYLDYGNIEEARRFAAIIKQTIEYKPQHRDEAELHVNLLGDIIQNKLHDPQDAAPMAEQVCRAIHLLIQGFAILAENFSKVYVHCASGNHGRDMNRHHSRATSGKWDSVETVIYYACKAALSKYDNIEFDIPKTPFCIYNVFGNKVFATHGDNVLDPGNPGKSLNIGKLENQINRINASLSDDQEVRVAVVGHTHVASLSQLASGAFLVTNGCLPPVDQFAVSIGILENRASQSLFEMTEKHPVGDFRMIQVGVKEDSNEALDNLINPWQTL